MTSYYFGDASKTTFKKQIEEWETTKETFGENDVTNKSITNTTWQHAHRHYGLQKLKTSPSIPSCKRIQC